MRIRDGFVHKGILEKIIKTIMIDKMCAWLLKFRWWCPDSEMFNSPSLRALDQELLLLILLLFVDLIKTFMFSPTFLLTRSANALDFCLLLKEGFEIHVALEMEVSYEGVFLWSQNVPPFLPSRYLPRIGPQQVAQESERGLQLFGAPFGKRGPPNPLTCGQDK